MLTVRFSVQSPWGAELQGLATPVRRVQRRSGGQWTDHPLNPIICFEYEAQPVTPVIHSQFQRKSRKKKFGIDGLPSGTSTGLFIEINKIFNWKFMLKTSILN
jgi:hypothetical protein